MNGYNKNAYIIDGYVIGKLDLHNSMLGIKLCIMLIII